MTKTKLLIVLCFLPALAVFLAASSPQQPQPVSDFCRRVYYSLLPKNLKADSDIVVVAIDDHSLTAINQPWPFGRATYAQALEILKQQGAKVVAFDIVFSGDSLEAAGDRLLADAIKNFPGKTVLGCYRDENGSSRCPAKELAGDSGQAFVNAIADADDIVRSGRLLFSTEQTERPSLALASAAYFKGAQLRVKNGTLLFNARPLPLDREFRMTINYLLKPSDLTVISLSDLLAGKFPADTFRNKIALIGATLEIGHDFQKTPLGRIPGVFINANALTTILQDRFLRPVPLPAQILLLLLTAASILFLVSFSSFLRGLLLSGGIFLILIWSNILLLSRGWVINVDSLFLALFLFLVCLELYVYSRFVAAILKIQHKMIHDPVSGLYNLRYFTERLAYSVKLLHRPGRYLVGINLTGLADYDRKNTLENIKTVWEKLSAILLDTSRHWAKAGPDILVGLADRREDIETLRETLTGILAEMSIAGEIRLCAVEIPAGSATREALAVFLENVKANLLPVRFLNKEEIFSGHTRGRRGQTPYYSLELDIEEKNRELLSAIDRLKDEQVRTRGVYFELVKSLVTALESKDPYTTGHSQRVAGYAGLLADSLNLSPEEKDRIHQAAMLHDLGKIGIPDAILHKKGRLTDEEFAVIKEHEVLSAKILEPIKEFREIIPYILHHHERFDGTGYPHGLAAGMIPLGARVIAVADVFDALITGRDYKTAFAPQDAAAELKRNKGTQFDPQLVDLFVQALCSQNICKFAD